MPSEPPRLPDPPGEAERTGRAHGYPAYHPGGPAGQLAGGPSPTRPTNPGLVGGNEETPPEIDGPPRRTSPITLVLNLGGAVLALLFLLPQLLTAQRPTARGASTGTPPVVLILVVGVVGLQLLIGGLAWFARTYTVGTRELVIDEGVLSRKRKVVPYARVQQVDISQPLIAQVFQLAILRIDTAGEGGASVKLGMIDVKHARGIRSHILRRRAELAGTLRDRGSSVPGVPGTWAAQVGPDGRGLHDPGLQGAGMDMAQGPEVELLHLGLGRLALAGLTHHVVIIAIPILVVIGLWIGAFATLTARQPKLTLGLGASVVIALFVGAFIAAMSLVQYTIGLYGFTLAEQGDDLHLRYGLFQVQNLTIPRRRVQHITILDNPVRRALGIVAIHLHSAAPMSVDSQGRSSTRFEIPILGRAEVDTFLHALMGGDWHVPTLNPRSDAARRRAVTRRFALVALLLVPPALAAMPGSLAILGFALVGLPWGMVAHRRAGFAETAEILVLAHGALRHRVDLLPYSRVQSCRTEQNPLQRWCDVRTLHVNVAGPARDPHLYDMPGPASLDYVHDLPRRSSPATIPTAPCPGRGSTSGSRGLY